MFVPPNIEIMFSAMLCNLVLRSAPRHAQLAKIHVKTKKNDLIESVRSAPRSLPRACIPSNEYEQHVALFIAKVLSMMHRAAFCLALIPAC